MAGATGIGQIKHFVEQNQFGTYQISSVVKLYRDSDEYVDQYENTGLYLSPSTHMAFKAMCLACWVKVTTQWHEPEFINYQIIDDDGLTGGSATAIDSQGETYEIMDLAAFVPVWARSKVVVAMAEFRALLVGELVDQ